MAQGARALALAEAYAAQRIQGGRPIDRHPDVARMLAEIRGITLAGRLLALEAGAALDRARRQGATEARVALLTPIVKAWCTDRGVDCANLGLQVHGGAGFIEETGAAQVLRDARIAPIYEGTNGIQAMDLVSRKLLRDGGAEMRALLAEVRAADSRLLPAAEALERVTAWLLDRGQRDPAAAEASAAAYWMPPAGPSAAGCWPVPRRPMLATRRLPASTWRGCCRGRRRGWRRSRRPTPCWRCCRPPDAGRLRISPGRAWSCGAASRSGKGFRFHFRAGGEFVALRPIDFDTGTLLAFSLSVGRMPSRGRRVAPLCLESGSAASASRCFGNRLLDTLAMADAALLQPHLTPVMLMPGAVLHADGEAATQAVFPCASTVLSIQMAGQDGGAVEAVPIGSEGMIGWNGDIAALASFRSLVQVGGPALRLEVNRLVSAASIAPGLKSRLDGYHSALLGQALQAVACAALHPVEARICRRLLSCTTAPAGPSCR
ncbi:acyl-CoA dehydrogenase family protein [Siccirubricoccus deserti]